MSEEIEPHIYRKFDIQQKLGKGAYGVVWKAVEKKSGQVVALKKVFEAFQNSTDAQRTFREVMILQEINGHENIVKLLNVIKAENKKDLYLVFEFMETDLHAVIKAGILTPIHKQYIIFQILKGLKYIHSGKIVHRDLKPSNVLINTECLIKIADFGLARSIACIGEDRDPIMTEYVATRWYRAPEIVLGSNRYSKAVDVWSVGCILAELVNGKALFPGKSTLNQVELILEVLGKPSESDLHGLNLESTMNIINSIKLRKEKSFSEYFKTEDRVTLDFLQKTLAFDHRKRMTIEEALEHPFLENFKESGEYKVLEKTVEIPIDENTRFSTSVYQEALYNEIIRKKKEQRRKWKEEYLKSLRLENKEKSDVQNQITKKESQLKAKSQPKEKEKDTKAEVEEVQDTEKKHTRSKNNPTNKDDKGQQFNMSQDSRMSKGRKARGSKESKETCDFKKRKKSVTENATKKSQSRSKKRHTMPNKERQIPPKRDRQTLPNKERSPGKAQNSKFRKQYSKEEGRAYPKEKRSETPSMMMKKQSPKKTNYGYGMGKQKEGSKRDNYLRRKSDITSSKAITKDKYMDSMKGTDQAKPKMKSFSRKKESHADETHKENWDKTRKERGPKKHSRGKVSTSSQKNSGAGRRGLMKYHRGMVNGSVKANINNHNNFHTLFSSKGKSKAKEGSYMMGAARKNISSMSKAKLEARKSCFKHKPSPKGHHNPYMKGSGARKPDMLFNQGILNKFHPPQYGVYANEHRQQLMSKFEGVFKNRREEESSLSKNPYESTKPSRHYSSLNPYEKNFHRTSMQARDQKQGGIYNSHLKSKKQKQKLSGSTQKDRHSAIGAKLVKYRSRDKPGSNQGNQGVGYSFRTPGQVQSQFDHSLGKNVYEDHLYSGFGAKRSRAFYMTNVLDVSKNKRGLGNPLACNMFMKNKARSKKSLKKSMKSMKGAEPTYYPSAKLGFEKKFKPEYSQNESKMRPEGNNIPKEKKGSQRKKLLASENMRAEWTLGRSRKKNKDMFGGREAESLRRKKSVKGQLDNKVSLLYRNLMRQEEKGG